MILEIVAVNRVNGKYIYIATDEFAFFIDDNDFDFSKVKNLNYDLKSTITVKNKYKSEHFILKKPL